MDALQSIHSSSIESCAALSDTDPLVAFGHTKRPRPSAWQAGTDRSIEPEYLHDVAAPTSKDKDVTGQGLLREYGLHLSAQPMEAATHIRRACRNPDARACRKRNHAMRLFSTTLINAASTLLSTLTSARPGSSI